MKKLNVKTASTQAGKIVPVQLGTPVPPGDDENFSAGDIWVGVTPDSTKTDGMIRIRQRTRSRLSLFCAGQYGDLIDTVYVMADARKKTVLKYRRWSGSYEKIEPEFITGMGYKVRRRACCITWEGQESRRLLQATLPCWRGSKKPIHLPHPPRQINAGEHDRGQIF